MCKFCTPSNCTQLTFVMPSRMCINPIHNNKGLFHQSDNANSEERWAASSCAMDSLYDLELISNTVPVVFDNSETWHLALSTSLKLGSKGMAHVQKITRVDLKEKSQYSNILLINRTASPLACMIGVIHVFVVGSQGWRLPDMMFATKCSLSDACNTIAKQLENVYSSIAASFSSYFFYYICISYFIWGRDHTSGSRSFPAAMSIAVKENGGLLPDLCNFYKDTHQRKKTKQWIDPICGDLHASIPII
ncbi:hypothetical protein HYC85_003225 [Camellia sinensis]|uniref:DUF1664 domain-containing protein n=1 Tax=Camellia sinensis TaxID=4442 RepID=A0A7J7IBV9_CAMSI|nr:hypothetical protein HYC85_003225 [Camellia sinensis]